MDSRAIRLISTRLTVFHALHVVCGLIALLAIAPGVARGKVRPTNTTAVRMCGMLGTSSTRSGRDVSHRLCV